MKKEKPLTIYCSSAYQKTYHLKNAIVTPLKINSRNHNNMCQYTGTVYDNLGRPIANPTTALWKCEDPPVIGSLPVKRFLKGKSVYLGYMCTHYGHFLIESLSRFLTLDGNYDHYIFHIHHKQSKIPTPKFMEVCFNCFGVNPNKIKFVTDIIKLEHLCVPPALFQLDFWVNSEQKRVFDKILEFCKIKGAAWNSYIPTENGNIVIKNPLNVYLSRRKWDDRITNEMEIEEMFKSLGFVVLFPEQIDFKAMVNLCGRADVLAGVQGSALHNSVFMRSGSKCVQLAYPKSYELSRANSGRIHPNQELCNALSNVDSYYIDFHGEGRKFDIDYLRGELELILAKNN